MEIRNDAGVSKLLASTEETRLCTGFGFTEGPIWIAADNCLLFSDIPGNRMHRWRPGSDIAEVYREPSGHANGHTLDASGRLVSCEHSGRRVSRAGYNAAAETLVAQYDGKTFNSPNDVVVHSSGAIYFTDPTYGLQPARPGREPFGVPGAQQEIDFQGVYRIDPDGALTLLVDDFNQPNGLAFTPDESVLYIGDSGDKTIRRFDVAADGSISGGELFVDMRPVDLVGVPDGMKVDADGRLWTTGAGGVWVIEADGTVLGTFETAEHAANLTFGGPNFSSLFLTAQTSVYRVETNVRGIVPESR
ncbi:MAG: SMP-30/gluconolactonase/LRE family protein [Chloroflexi bacterium]|nr:SMP-30/gluconolactonase/LRE family protein [Chloroflexota bacterium]MDA1146871.1 SMP-30/gluconolactonase/LRE family protein [Chloroflexota bacterium]